MKRVIRLKPNEIGEYRSYAQWQALYMDHQTGWLVPDTEIWSGETLLLRINSLGCRGDDLRPGVPAIGFFGDSATFGVSSAVDNWPGRVSIPGYQVLNAAVEGHSMSRVLQRYKDLSSQIRFAVVVVYTGWHNIIYNETSPEYWSAVLDEFSGGHLLALCTLGTCLRDECSENGIEPLLSSGSPCGNTPGYFEYNSADPGRQYFNFWCDMEPTRKNVKRVLYGVRRFNAFLRTYCEDRGRLVLDLHSVLLPKSYEDIPAQFFDVCHPRPSAYPMIGEYVGRVLGSALGIRGTIGPNPGEMAGRPPLGGGNLAGAALRSGSTDLRKNIYPLW